MTKREMNKKGITAIGYVFLLAGFAIATGIFVVLFSDMFVEIFLNVAAALKPHQ